MQDKGHILRLAVIRASITTPTIILITAIAVLFLSLLPLISHQPAYSQTTTPGSQNLSSVFKNFLKPQKDVSGHYSNPEFGIVDIVFPDGWHGSEIPSQFGLVVFMHPGNQNQNQNQLASPFALRQSTQQQPLRPQIMFQVIDNSALAEENSITGKLTRGFSISKSCKQLAQNSTSIIDGKTFNIMTVECPFSSLISSRAASAMTTTSNQSNVGNNNNLLASLSKLINANGIMQTKLFEYKGPGRTYRLALIVSNQLFSTPANSPTQEKPDILKYTQLIDTTANTLKFR